MLWCGGAVNKVSTFAIAAARLDLNLFRSKAPGLAIEIAAASLLICGLVVVAFSELAFSTLAIRASSWLRALGWIDCRPPEPAEKVSRLVLLIAVDVLKWLDWVARRAEMGDQFGEERHNRAREPLAVAAARFVESFSAPFGVWSSCAKQRAIQPTPAFRPPRAWAIKAAFTT